MNLNKKMLFKAVFRGNPAVIFRVKDNSDGIWDKYTALVKGEPVVLVAKLKSRNYLVYPVSFAFFPDWEIMYPSGIEDVNRNIIYEKDTVIDKDKKQYTVVLLQGKFILKGSKEIELTGKAVKDMNLQVIKVIGGENNE